MHLKPNLTTQKAHIYIWSIWGSSFLDFTYRLQYQRSRRQHIWHICIYCLLLLEVTDAWHVACSLWCDVISCSLAYVYQCFRGTCWFQFQSKIGMAGWKLSYPYIKLQGITFPNTLTLILTILKTSFLFSVQIYYHYLEDVIHVLLVHDCDYPQTTA